MVLCFHSRANSIPTFSQIKVPVLLVHRWLRYDGNQCHESGGGGVYGVCLCTCAHAVCVCMDTLCVGFGHVRMEIASLFLAVMLIQSVA